MAFGSLSSLGFGSGVLTQDTIDKLKEAEQKLALILILKKLKKIQPNKKI